MDTLETHNVLFGPKSPPSEKQCLFYKSEAARGFSTKDPDPDLTDAVLVRALAQARIAGSPDYEKVYVMFPDAHRAWIVERIHHLATSTMTRMQPILKTPKGATAIAHVRRWLEALQLGPVEAWKGTEAPPRWVSFGYSKEDNVPGWLKESLV